MRRAVVCAMVLIATPMSAAMTAAERGADLAVAIRIHDYVAIPSRTLVRAQLLVSEYYRAIKVETKWRAIMRPSKQAGEAHQVSESEVRDLTVIIVNESMARQLPLPANAVGSAATTPSASGRIAYVLYDRVVAAALGSGWETVDLMSVVIAHEVGHLLLPWGSHTSAGLMRTDWRTDDLRRVDRRTLTFSDDQAEHIRRVLRILP